MKRNLAISNFKDRVLTGPHGPFNYPNFQKVAQFMSASYDLRKILRAARARQDGGPLQFPGIL
jgi:hypothetical protein